MAASIGAFLLAAGNKDKRYYLPNSRIMIHQPSGGAHGQASDIEIHAQEILDLRKRLNKILAEKTGQTVEQIALDTERDRFKIGRASCRERGGYGERARRDERRRRRRVQ